MFLSTLEAWKAELDRAAPVLVSLIALFLAVGAILSFHIVGKRFYAGFWIPQGSGMNTLLPEEFTHATLYVVFGLSGMAFLLMAFRRLNIGERDLALIRRIADSGLAAAVGAGVFVFVGTLLIGRYVLHYAVTSDDEHVYRFIAQTLRTGSLTAPSPGNDLEFFREQFVVLTEQVRYGKYPIGHPLLLAVGQLVGGEHLVVPLVTALVALPLFALGTWLCGRPTAALALLFFALSPQVLLTGATLVSQPASALCLVSGLACLFAAEQRADWPRRWLALSGILFGYGMLVRPLPGVLFALAAAVYVLLRHPPYPARPAGVGRWASFGAPLIVFAGLILIINWKQTGSLLTSGYQVVHRLDGGVGGLFGLLEGDIASRAMSLVGSLIRLNFWLLGWPVSLALCLFARRTPRVYLLWAMIGAALCYRLIAPKVGVGSTGPIYLFEVVPLLCLLSADGLMQLIARVSRRDSRSVWASRLVAAVMASILIGLTMFLPLKLSDLSRMADAQLVLPRMIRQAGLSNALVFYAFAVPPPLGLSWAYYPRFNSPRLDDDVLLVRLKPEASGLAKNLEFWRRRFPQRSAWYFGHFDGMSALVPLEAYVQGRSTVDRQPGRGAVQQ